MNTIPSSEADKERFKLISGCQICREYLAHCMVQPLRCPGLSYDEEAGGRKYVGRKGTSSFRYWDEIVAEHEARWTASRLAFWDNHKDHLWSHGWKVETTPS